MKLRTKDNLAEVERDLDSFRDSIISVAVPRALNTLLGQAEVAGFREIARIYGIPAKMIRDEQYTTIKAASAADLEASITVKGRGFPLSVFKPVKTPRGIAVTIKGRRIEIPHAFFGKGKLPGTRVFARGAYGGKGNVRATGETFGRFVFGKARLPVNELYSFAPPDTLRNQRVQDVMDARMDEQGPKVMAREIAAAKRGF